MRKIFAGGAVLASTLIATTAIAATVWVFGSAVRPTPPAAYAAAYDQAASACVAQGGTPATEMSGTLEWNGSGYLYYGHLACVIP